MLFCISGAQGSGKSTVLKELEKLNYNVIERKTARSVLSEMDTTLPEIYANLDLHCEYQDKLLQRKMDDEREAIASNDVWFTERSYADLLGYAIQNIAKDPAYSDWLIDYDARCKAAQRNYEAVFYIRSGMFDVVDDGVRNASTHFSIMMDMIIGEKSLEWMCDDVTMVNAITTDNLQSRIDQIQHELVWTKTFK